MKNTYCVCYNTLDIFTSKNNAKKFYTECFYGSEGSEHERYANILVDLMYSNIGLDNVDEDIWRICYFDKNNRKIKEEKIDRQYYLKAIEKIENRG